ncbi:DUF4302 domain-containing protein [Chitinophagaceae bacterium 26-R-25]|nr:DUF4302 domain-containing protein [Chitinophagaceae bacterium 26-R-25]
MKLTNSILYAVVALMLLSGCKKDYDKSVFEQLPQERTAEMLKDYKTILTSAPYGWQAYVYPGSGNLASTFLFKFDSTNRVVTSCDLAGSTITTPVESSYSLRALQMTTLVFDTYSYLHLLADPDPNVIGGTSGQGLYSDYEFYFMKVSDNKDTIWMEGAQKGMPLTLVKVTDDNRGDVEQGFDQDGGKKMADMQTRIQSYLPRAMFFNMKMQDGKQMSLSYAGGSVMYFRYQNDTTGKLVNQGTLFSYTAKGIHFRDTIWYKKYPFTDLIWNQGTNNGFYIDGIYNNSQISNTPDFPLSSLFGNGFTGLFQPAGYPDQSAAAISASYKDLIKTINDSVNGRGYTFREMDYLFSPSKKEMTIYVSLGKGGQAFYGTYTYNFALANDGKTYTFTYQKQDPGGENLRYAMNPVLKYFETGSKQLTLDYYQSDSYGMLGQFKSIDDPNFFFVVIPF